MSGAELRAELDRLNAAANTGDREAVAALAAFLNAHPELERFFGDLSRHAEAAWIGLIAGEDALSHETVKRRLAKTKTDLLGLRPTTLERLVVDHLAVCHLAERHAAIDEANTTGGTPAQEMVRIRRAESAQKRMLVAVKLLDLIRTTLPLDTDSTPTIPISAGVKKSKLA